MIPGKNQYLVRFLRFDGINVLIDGVRRAAVPTLSDSLLSRDNVNIFLQLRIEDIPPLLQMQIQGMRFILGQDVDSADAGIDTVGKSKINDPVDPAEGNRRFGAVSG